MKTEHVDFPKKGDTMFNGDLMVEVTHVEPLENGDYTFDFWVYNGHWGGKYYSAIEHIDNHRAYWGKAGKRYIEDVATGPSPPFLKVLETTDEEKERWYLK